MTFKDDREIRLFDTICESLGYSRSDTLRLAVREAFKLNWRVPLYRKPEEQLSQSGKSMRKARSKAKE